jgi:hypothetical protein
MTTSIIYDSLAYDLATGGIDFASDKIKVQLVGAEYRPEQGAHQRRADLTDIVGEPAATTASVALRQPPAHRLDVALGGAVWTAATLTARGAVYYKAAGSGDPEGDPLICFVDFGNNVKAVAGDFTLMPSTLRIRNQPGD